MSSAGLAAALERNTPPEAVIFGTTRPMQVIRERIRKIAAANLPVLIEGESGTGKDIVARIIHGLSPWESGTYVKVNCPAIPGSLIESELFGYEKGAFTGAYGTKPGRVELADRGTLFLDEISELDYSLQSKLLQLLQDGQFCRIGSQEDRRIEVRVICATNRNLEKEVETGRFRQDLYYRINVVNIRMPALRERAADVPVLVSYFISLYNEKYNCRSKPLSPQTIAQLQQYHWPGNIRELENLMRRYAILGSEEAILSELAPRQTAVWEDDIPADGRISLKKLTRRAVLELERKVILRVLQANHWNRKRAARALNISYRALLYKIKDVGLPSARSRGDVTPGDAGSEEIT
jgi:two-component system, NtrC family, response regulator AtoC